MNLWTDMFGSLLSTTSTGDTDGTHHSRLLQRRPAPVQRPVGQQRATQHHRRLRIARGYDLVCRRCQRDPSTRKLANVCRMSSGWDVLSVNSLELATDAMFETPESVRKSRRPARLLICEEAFFDAI